MWLLIDAKFLRGISAPSDAQERGDVQAAESASAALESGVKNEAKRFEEIVHPPHTPTCDSVSSNEDCSPRCCDARTGDSIRIIADPRTANNAGRHARSLMGFRTLAVKAIEQFERVAVKTEFGEFGRPSTR